MLQTVVALFVKPPVSGKVKTRLARDIGNNAACAVYRHLADEIIRQVQASALPLVIFFDGTDPEELPVEWRTAARQWLPQQGNDLGERMAHAFTLLFKEGFTQAMLLGSDIFGIDATYLHTAIDLLADHDMVISPALDGGYCLIGFHQEQFSATLFENIPWSSDQVFQMTMKSAETLKLSAGVLPPLQDIDTCDDLQAVCEQTAVTDALTDLRKFVMPHRR